MCFHVKTFVFLVAVVLATGVRANAAEALAMRAQTLGLQAGWNAVFLEVDPANPEPEAVFDGTPVDIAASFFERTASAQFVVNPEANIHKRAGWGVWYGPDRPDQFLSTLHSISGQRAYLLHATEDYVWEVEGYVVRLDMQWRPDAFNLVGFTVAAQGPPSFGEFFGGSSAHSGSAIYRLENNAWRRVVDPAAESMRSGEAFWIYCAGGSTYQGPLGVDMAVQQGPVLRRTPGEIVLRNDTWHPLTPKIEHVAAQGEPVPMSLVMQGVRGGEAIVRSFSAPLPAGPWVQDLPPIEAGQGLRIPMEALGKRSGTPARYRC